MEFDLSTIDEMNNAQPHVPLSMSMHTLVGSANDPPHPQLVWNTPADLSTLPLQDVIDMHSEHPPQALQLHRPHVTGLPAHQHGLPAHHAASAPPQAQRAPQPTRPPTAVAPPPVVPQPQPKVTGQKRRYEDTEARDVDDSCEMSGDESDTQTPGRLPTIALNEPLEIDPQVVCQMGGLPYADLCKERAREAFKEAKKNEHYANGDHDRLRRKKKNDTSMTPRQKYVRRLRMNQDSAAAARHAQEVYVQVLEKLVKSSEVEKKSFMVEMQQIRSQNDLLFRKVQELQVKITELEQETCQSGGDLDEKRNDPAFAKILDMLKTPSYIGAQADMGVQPARAV